MSENLIYVAIEDDFGINEIRATESEVVANEWLNEWVRHKENDGFEAEIQSEHFDNDKELYVTEAQSSDDATLSVYKVKMNQ